MIRALAWLWLALLVALPLAVVLLMGFGAAQPGIPPVRPPFGPAGWQGSLEGWSLLLADTFYLEAAGRSARLAGLTAALCLVLGFAMALGIARAPAARQPALVALVLAPFLVGFVLRMAAWVGLLRDSGLLNRLAAPLGLGPWQMLHTDGALLLGMVHSYLPFAVLPLWAALSRRDVALEEAAADLGASPFTAWRTVTLPLAAPAALAAFLLVFIPAMGEVVIPELLGPPDAVLLGRAIWGEFFQTRDWPLAAVLATALLALLLLPLWAQQRLARGRA
ncbi:ABC transporter permease [Roseococcus sp. DSY-14]|uniref:ABC transporter permease n=1 Tax=Roseococcus sp. DSY-14 TaxID=3369650 RepID=UPI00387B7349